MAVRRLFVEKKSEFNSEATNLLTEIRDVLKIKGLEKLRILQRYDIEGISDADYEKAKNLYFKEPFTDLIHEEEIQLNGNDRVIAIEYQPGQYDQRADFAAQCIQFISQKERPIIKAAKILILTGKISDEEYNVIVDYLINPVETRMASLEKPETIRETYPEPQDVPVIDNFINMTTEELETLMEELGFAMSLKDLEFCQTYFRDTERRNPTLTELRMIDTYWSDHCRHTTFLTELEEVRFSDNKTAQKIKETYDLYLDTRNTVYKDKEKDITLMDIATLAMKYLKSTGDLDNLDESDEINACSIIVKANVDGKEEDWLVMFKNETHNHPTEIEPFGGAATCLGGAIRDPLSGRSYVYQAMRITGAADPRKPVSETLPGKLPQRVITTTAARGYSSYGNQIGVASGLVSEIYHEDYVAKRMELGALVGAAPRSNVVRKAPEAGDIIILLGGRTGRDGCGGATGSSKEHTEESLTSCGAEVQKGNAPLERNIQRLFKKAHVARMIKKCNDFGAGGVSVAIGELADGLDINLDAVPTKYEGLDGTELAISESQERMAVVVSAGDADKFIEEAMAENLEATPVAVVTDLGRLRMKWRDKVIVDLSRDFLNTNGVKQTASVKVTGAKLDESPLKNIDKEITDLKSDYKNAWIKNLERLNVCSQKGLAQQFDSTVGGGTVLAPYGGKYQLTPIEGMVAKLPVESGDTTTGTIMTYGYNPYISKWSPYHGAVYAVLESVSRIVAVGGDYKKVRLTFQEYFEKLGKDEEKWGKPFSALLGAFHAQMSLKLAAIGGKDSMSGTFENLDVPPTLVSFALAPADITSVITPELKRAGSKLILLPVIKDELLLPDFENLKAMYTVLHDCISRKKVLSAMTIKMGGIAEAVSKMAFGNKIGVKLKDLEFEKLFGADYGSILVEIPGQYDEAQLFEGISFEYIGETISEPVIESNGTAMPLDNLSSSWQSTLEDIFPTKVESEVSEVKSTEYTKGVVIKKPSGKIRPKVIIPACYGTNSELDIKRKFDEAGADAEIFVIRNLTPDDITDSINTMKKLIDESQILVMPGGYSATSETDGSAKLLAAVFRNPVLAEAVMNLLNKRDGLILGIGTGFQVLLKLGLLPYGEIRPLDDNSPVFTLNPLGRHISAMVNTKVVSNLSPWLSGTKVGEVYTVAVSSSEGRFVASEALLSELEKSGQIAAQYVDFNGNPSMDIQYNPFGSMFAIESLTSRDGRVFGKMGHSERFTKDTLINIPGNKNQKIFEAGVEYFL